MFRKNGLFKKYRRILLGILCLLFLLIISSMIFIPLIKGSGVHPAGHAVATATPDVTASPLLSPTPKPLFSDNFQDNSKRWPLSNENDTTGYLRSLTNNQLVLTDTNHKILTESLPTSTAFSDFSFTTTFTLLKGDGNDSVGLYLRGDSNLDHDYRIDIFGNSMYSISKESLDTNKQPQTATLVDLTATKLLHPNNQANVLSVTMDGSSLQLAINGTTVESLVDTDYTHGQIALFVQNGGTSNEVSASFSAIDIEALPDLASPTATAVTRK